ncbi:MAG TPA: ATP-binding protein [Ohtaekwangia sp.]|nr:ATP-binding protein [Ohtaekwangia sp.]
MTLDFNPDSKLKLNRFSKLGMWYILALSAIATVSIVGQILIQRHLHSQTSDSRVVNLAGTQRYKSQWIVKMSMLLYTDLDHRHFPDKIKTLEQLLQEWRAGHYGLQHGDDQLNLPGHNSTTVNAMFTDIEPYFLDVYNNAKKLIEYKQRNNPDSTAVSKAIQAILDNEFIFLEKMDRIVFQYDAEARAKIDMLSKLEYILLAISIVVIVLEIIFVFRPTTVQVNNTVNQLIHSEKNAKKLSKEIGALYTSLEKSYEEISQVNLPKETPKLYAKTDRGGNVIFISDLYAGIAGKSPIFNGPLHQLFEGSDLDAEWQDDVIEIVSGGSMWQGMVHYRDARGTDHWSDTMIVPVVNDQSEIDEWLVLGADITRQKMAEKNMRDKSRAEIEKKINQQKFRSVLILEGQEEERKRLAMDIHDGIGQMLTSLKFQIESIDTHRDAADIQRKLAEIQQLITQVIKEVRRVTFNLKPTVLGDYGLQSALNVFIREIGKVTDIDITYQTEGDVTVRLPQKVENNIFRIIQEAINNAIKYSGANAIAVTLQQGDHDLTITVNDNGTGFDEKLVESRSVNIESGRGFFNMYERTEYVNGKLEIRSAPGHGTTVVLVVPVKNLVTV